MDNILDDYAWNNGLLEVSPAVKVLLGLGAILICISSSTPTAPLLAAVALSLAVILLARIPLRVYLMLWLIPLSFAILSALVVVLVTGTGDAILDPGIRPLGLTLVVREDGLRLGELILSRAAGGSAALFFVALTTPMAELFALMKRVKVPQVLIELAMLVYRYIFLGLGEAATIHQAQSMRLAGSNWRSSLDSLSLLGGMLFIRSWERGERIMKAMDCRCYDGKLVLEGSRPLKGRHLAAALMFLGAIAAVSYLTQVSGRF